MKADARKHRFRRSPLLKRPFCAPTKSTPHRPNPPPPFPPHSSRARAIAAVANSYAANVMALAGADLMSPGASPL